MLLACRRVAAASCFQDTQAAGRATAANVPAGVGAQSAVALSSIASLVSGWWVVMVVISAPSVSAFLAGHTSGLASIVSQHMLWTATLSMYALIVECLYKHGSYVRCERHIVAQVVLAVCLCCRDS
jgi:hypothetical protein